jgi:hypothetical protein
MRVEDAVAFRESMAEKVVLRLEQIYVASKQPVTLIGWSLGGLYALDASLIKPEWTRQVITLGAPFGDPRGTAAFKLLRRLNGSQVPIEEQDFSLWNTKCELPEDYQIPVKVLRSDRDGIVGQGISQLKQHPCVENIPVDSSHIGFAVNPRVLSVIAKII